MGFQKLDKLLTFLTSSGEIPALSMAIGRDNSVVYHRAVGVHSETGIEITDESVFDIASLTKVLSGICFMKLVEMGSISLNEPVCRLFPQMDTIKPVVCDGTVIDACDAGRITWYHVLTHTTGFGWTGKKTRPSLPGLDQGLDVIFRMPLAYKTGERVVYSDIPIILMGKAIEMLTGMPLDLLVKKMICEPLSLANTGYRRVSDRKAVPGNVLPTEYDDAFRHERVWGVVHDENAYLLDGVAAHAGIFSTALDMCHLAMAYQACLTGDGLVRKETAQMMVREQVSEDGDRRGILWQLSGRGHNAYTRHLSSEAYGHTGFTGCFLWNDPVRHLSVVLLSNDVYNGRDARRLPEYRSELMETAVTCACEDLPEY